MKSDVQEGNCRGWLRVEFVGTVNTGVNAKCGGLGGSVILVLVGFKKEGRPVLGFLGSRTGDIINEASWGRNACMVGDLS